LAVIRGMKIPHRANAHPASDILQCFSGATRLMKAAVGTFIALLFLSMGDLRGQTSQGYQVKLSWKASSSTDVTGYRIHYGTASGKYTSTLVLGNVTSTTISGLANGPKYHFSVSALTAAGLESDFSNEVNFMPGIHASQIHIAANGAPVLTVQGLIGSQYDIEASADMKTWSLIATVTLPNGGSLQYSDPHTALHPRRFYRTRQRP
jgi:hypothetical protein